MGTILAEAEVDLITRSPDGESRGEFFRVGDLFPMNPIGHILMAPGTPATEARPWGLRFRRVPGPRAGKHEGGTSDVSTNTDSDNAEEVQSD